MEAEGFIADRLRGMCVTMLPMYRVIAVSLLTILPFAAQAAVGTAQAPPDSAHYRRCLEGSSANPALALGDAQAWSKSGGGVPAEHCAALALVNLKRYA